MGPKTRFSKFFKEILIIGNVVGLNITYLAIYHFYIDNIANLPLGHYYELLLAFNIAWILSSYINKLYSIPRTNFFHQQVTILTKSLGLYCLLLLAWMGVRSHSFNMEFFWWVVALSSLNISVFFLGFFLLVRFSRNFGFNSRKVVIVGYGDISKDLARYFDNNRVSGYTLKGIFDDREHATHLSGTIDDLFPFLIDEGIHEVYCVLPHVEYKRMQEISRYAEGHLIKVKIIPDYRGIPFSNLDVQLYGGIPVLNFKRIPLDDIINRSLKRAFDICVSLAITVLLLSWLTPIIALMIKLESRGPFLFRQVRAGKDNQPFWCYKFRTMRLHSEPDHRQATRNDPRITRIGAFLRRTSLDELPQFLNVLLGDMSIIGPRPHPVKLNEQYSNKIDRFMYRHAVKPGITGLAQIRGYRGETRTVKLMENRVRLDLFYVQKWSLPFDLRIFMETVRSTLTGEMDAY